MSTHRCTAVTVIGARLGRQAYTAGTAATAIEFREAPADWTPEEHELSKTGFRDGYDVAALADPNAELTVDALTWWGNAA